MVHDARYSDMREPISPVAYVPFDGITDKGTAHQTIARATFIVRTSNQDPLSTARALPSEVIRARPEFRVIKVRTQLEVNQ